MISDEDVRHMEARIAQRAIDASPHARVVEVATGQSLHRLRHALVFIGWQGPLYKSGGDVQRAAQHRKEEVLREHLALVTDTWTNVVAGLTHWYSISPDDFDNRVPPLLF